MVVDLSDAYWDGIKTPPKNWTNNLTLTTKTGHNVRYGIAKTYLEEVKGSIVMTMGYGENFDLHYEGIKYYQKLGYDVYAMDWHYQGGSGRVDPNDSRKPPTDTLDTFTPDLDALIEQVVLPNHPTDKPLFMSTNSMGGHIALLYLENHDDVFDGVVMSTPMFDLKFLGFPAFTRPAFRLIFNAAAKMGLKDIHMAQSWESLERLQNSCDNSQLTLGETLNTRREVCKELQDRQPCKKLGVPTIGWIAATKPTIEKVLKPEFLSKIQTPILIGTAENESFVDNKAHKTVAQHLPNATQVNIDNAGHSLWFEEDDNLVLWWGHIRKFLHDAENHRVQKKRLRANPMAYTI